MKAMDAERSTYDLLENWRNELQLSYIRLATKIAKYEESHMLASQHPLYPQLDRVEREIERAEYALRLFRAQHMHVLLPMLAEQRDKAS